MVVPRSQLDSLPQEPVYLPLSAWHYNLLYALEQLHTTPQHLQLLIATPGGAASLFSLVLAKFLSLAPALVSSTQLLVDNHLAACPSKVAACTPGHNQITGFTPTDCEPRNSTYPCKVPEARI